MKKLLILLVLLLIFPSIYAQVGVGTTTPDHSSVLDVESTTKGFLPPRMTTLQRDSINSGTFAEGLIIYNTDENCLNFYYSNNWINPCTGSVSNPAPLPPPALTGNITLTPGQTQYIVSVYDNDYSPYATPIALATTGPAVAGGGNETLVNVQGVLNTTTGLTVKIPYAVSSGSVSLPAFSQTRTVIAAHIQGANPLSNDGGGTPVDIELSYDAQPSLSTTGFITATIKAVSTDLNAVKLDVNAGIGTDFGILLAEFSIAINDAGDTGPIYLKDIAGVPDRNFADAEHKFIYFPVVGPDGKTWLNNNLGANYANINMPAVFNPSQQATTATDHQAYGSLYQWGRFSDGHELITWTDGSAGSVKYGNSSASYSTTITPNNHDFYFGDDSPSTQDYNWLDLGSGQNSAEDALWQGESGVNNPCPVGYRLPTNGELTTLFDAIISSGSNGNGGIDDAFNSTLKFTPSGRRYFFNGSVFNEGSDGRYWSSSVSGSSVHYRYFLSSSANSSTNYRAFGLSVRCLKD